MTTKPKLSLVLKALVENEDEKALKLLDQAYLDKKRANMRNLALKFSHEDELGIYYRTPDTLYCFREFRGGTFKLIDCDDLHKREVPFERIKMMDFPDNPKFVEFMRGMLGCKTL